MSETRHLENMLVRYHLLQRRSNHQMVVLFMITYSTLIFYPLLVTSVFQLMKT